MVSFTTEKNCNRTLISGFHHDVDICALLGYYTPSHLDSTLQLLVFFSSQTLDH